ncbi:hypothetical protein PHMEG_00025017 [Phytophthora megakarya]|uniref:ATP-dependent DNA helicase n=1 Tax=Phytophthora megakarya TaxID=4795 RepID=A0A225VD32_9STRA|nr:hypothetical protein PHMEG_00025017 [Phytophthora megakarya]
MGQQSGDLVLVGDFLQMPPVKSEPIYLDPIGKAKPNTMDSRGFDLWRTISTVLVLNESVRFRKDPQWREGCRNAPNGTLWSLAYVHFPPETEFRLVQDGSTSTVVQLPSQPPDYADGQPRTFTMRAQQFPFVCAVGSTMYKVQGESLQSMIVMNWKSTQALVNKPQTNLLACITGYDLQGADRTSTNDRQACGVVEATGTRTP